MRRDIFLALALLAAACGDDSSSDDSSNNNDEEPTEDAGRDSGDQPKADAGTDSGGGKSDAGEVSEELKEAQKTDGVSATQARADLLINAFCAKAPDCESMTSESACKAVSNEGWMNLVDNEAPDDCKDAELDRFACLSKADCDELATGCKDFEDKVTELCGEASMP